MFSSSRRCPPSPSRSVPRAIVTDDTPALLHAAIRSGSIEAVEQSLVPLTFFGVNHPDTAGKSPLCMAIEAGNMGMVKRLLQCDDILPDTEALMSAAHCQQVEAVQMLLRHRVPPDGLEVLGRLVDTWQIHAVDTLFAAGLYVPKPDTLPENLREALKARARHNARMLREKNDTLLMNMPIGYALNGVWYISRVLSGDTTALTLLGEHARRTPDAMTVWLHDVNATHPLSGFRVMLKFAFLRLNAAEHAAAAILLSREEEKALFENDSKPLDRLFQEHDAATLEAWATMLTNMPEARVFGRFFHQLAEQINNRVAKQTQYAEHAPPLFIAPPPPEPLEMRRCGYWY